jgi:peptidoglycan/LPS O-acetylase OafA/YrhL
MLSVEHYTENLSLPRLFSFFPMVILWGVAALWAEGTVAFLAPLFWGLTFFTLVNNLVEREQSGRLPFKPAGNKVCRLITWSGTFSYSTYLVHNPARAVLTQLLGPLARTSNPFLFTAIALFLSAAGLFAGWMFYFLVERHFLNVKPSALQPQLNIAVSQVDASREARRCAVYSELHELHTYGASSY